MGRYWANCFWLVVPVLGLNVALGGHLPPVFDAAVAAEKVPNWLALVESGLRLLTVALPAVMPLAVHDGRGRAGLVLYLVGLAAYALSWVPLVGFADSAWSTSLIGLVAPAVTPMLWMAGIALIGDRDYRWIRLPRWTFAMIATAFAAAHVARTLHLVG
jgi:hypothetical protein